MEKKKKWWITKIFEKIVWSFDNSSSGFSARKLSAWGAVMLGMYITVHYVDTSILVNVLGIWLVFALLCLGIITAEQIIRFKDGNTTEKNEDDNTENQESQHQHSDPKI